MEKLQFPSFVSLFSSYFQAFFNGRKTIETVVENLVEVAQDPAFPATFRVASPGCSWRRVGTFHRIMFGKVMQHFHAYRITDHHKILHVFTVFT